MALTFRTGSGGKGSALTIDELDNNIRHFTGSHDVSGSFEVTGSIVLTGSLDLDGIFTNKSLQISQSVISAPDAFPVVINDQLSLNGNSLIAVTSITASSGINATGEISSSANVSGLSGSFTALILTAPNGNKFKFTTDNSGLLSITGSAV